jgi:hypothetical protein
MFFRLINKKRMAAQNPKNSKNVPCTFWNSHEGCTNSDEKCKFAHKKACNHIGCIKRGKTFTHNAEDCGFMKELAPQEKEDPLPFLEILYLKVQNTLATKEVPVVVTAGKIVGMVREAYETPQIRDFLSNQTSYDALIEEAIATLLK